jgi:3D (Asp-Asp-Asp) domain-containing protein
MSSQFHTGLALLAATTILSAAHATALPALPASSVAEQAVQNALNEPTLVATAPAKAAPTPSVAAKPAAPTAPVAAKPAAPTAPVAAKPAPAAKPVVKAAAKPAPKPSAAAQVRQQGVAQAQRNAASRATNVRSGLSAVVRSTAYNSIPNQTDSTPFITATGTRTRFGVIALSRDLLRKFPYGTRVRIEDLSGRFNGLLAGRIFIVEDTMHPRKVNTVDVWMSTRSQAMQWGVRNIRVTAVN